MRLASGCLLTVLLALTPLHPASAQDAAASEGDASAHLARAERAIEDADFATAVLELDAAATGALDRSSLVRWLELHALLAYADGRLGALDEALRGLASLGEEVSIPAAFPRPLRDRLLELRGEAPRIVAIAEPAVSVEGDHRVVALPASVTADPGHLVRGLEVRLAIDGEAASPIAAGETRAIAGDIHRDVELTWRITAVGPGGAVVAEMPSTTERSSGVPRSNDDALIAGIVTGAVLAVGATAILAWGATDNWWRGDTTVVTGPLITF